MLKVRTFSRNAELVAKLRRWHRDGKDLTTGLIAKILGVAPRTVSKMVDSGHLPGYRLDGSDDRRVRVDEFLEHLRRTENQRLPEVLEALDLCQVVLIISDDGDLALTLQDLLGEREVETVGVSEALPRLASSPVAATLVDFRLGFPDLQPFHHAAQNGLHDNVGVVLGFGAPSDLTALIRADAPEVYRDTFSGDFDVDQIALRVRDFLGMAASPG
jgi:excisionase family DNA binding protein